MSKINRQAIIERDRYCSWCGRVLPEIFAVHHRKLKSRGGTDALSNLVALCHKCHNLGSESVHLNVQEATARGFLVSSWDSPEMVPLVLNDGSKVMLDDEGFVKAVEGCFDE